MKRRAFLARCIQGVAGGVVLCQGARARPSARDLGARDDLDATLRWVLDTPRDRVLREASRRLLDGLPQATLRDATLLAAVAAIKPPPVGFCDHAVMAAYSHRQLVAELAAQFDQSAELADKLPPAWEQGRDEPAAAREILAAARAHDGRDVAALARSLLAKGIGPGSAWDGIVMAAAERVLQSRDIVSLHAFTGIHALHTIALAARSPRTRAIELLQLRLFPDARFPNVRTTSVP